MYFLITDIENRSKDDVCYLIYRDDNGNMSMYSVFHNVATKCKETSDEIDNWLRFNPWIEVLYEGENPPEDIMFAK